MAERPWVEAILMAKMKDWSWEMKMCEKEIEGKRARPWLGRVVIQMKLEAYETCIFFFGTQMHIYWPHLITDHQSETERAWEGDSRATWRENEATSFILALQSSAIKIIITWKFDLPFWPIVRFYLHHFALIEQKDMLCFKCNFTSSFFFFPWQIWERKISQSQWALHKLRS